MIEDAGDILVSDCDEANIPVVCFIHEPDNEGKKWRWTASNFMPRKETCGGSYELIADTKEEIIGYLKKYVIPLYQVAIDNLSNHGQNYYWEAKK